MGIIVNVYRSYLGDCTRGGLSSKHDKLCVVNCKGPFTPSDDAPAVLLESHVKGCVRLVPAVKKGNTYVKASPETGSEQVWFMAGGNYAATSDSRFTQQVENMTDSPFYGAVAIHDRLE